MCTHLGVYLESDIVCDILWCGHFGVTDSSAWPSPVQGVSGVVESLKIITQEKSYRIAKYAFDYAVRYNRKKVTAIHKANIM